MTRSMKILMVLGVLAGLLVTAGMMGWLPGRWGALGRTIGAVASDVARAGLGDAGTADAHHHADAPKP
jgi:hypothetical protein